MKKTAAGSESFDKLFDDLYQRLYYSAQKYSDDRDLLDFVVSGTIQDFYQKGFNLRTDDVMRQLYTAVKHRCFDVLASRRAHRRIDKQWALENLPAMEDPILSQAIIEAELFAMAKVFIGKLPPRYKQAVEGYYLQKIPAKELARIMGIRVTTVHQLKDLGIEKLFKLFKDHGLYLYFVSAIEFISRNH